MRPPFLRACLCLTASALLLGPLTVRAEGAFSASALRQGLAQAAPEQAASDMELPALGELLPPLPELPRGRVLLVLDGDSVRLADRRTIRLACIDAPDLGLSGPDRRAPEEHRKNFHVEPGTAEDDEPRPPRAVEQTHAAQAHDALRHRALRQAVTLLAPSSRKDPQGRLVCDVELDDGTSLSAYLVSRGLAYVVRDPDYPQEYADALLALQNRAMAERLGFWGTILDLEAARQPWIGSSETGLFYSSRDVRGQQIKPRLRVYFGTLLDAFAAGFAPASSRDFWPGVVR